MEECTGGRVERVIGWLLISLQRLQTQGLGPRRLEDHPVSPQGLMILTHGKVLVCRNPRRPNSRMVGRATSAEDRRGAERRRPRPSKVGSERAGTAREALRAALMVLGDVDERLGPHLRGTPRRAVVAEEAQTMDRVADPAEDLAADRVTEPVMDEEADEDHLVPKPGTKSSRFWRGCPNAWCRRRTPRDDEESTTGISSLESDGSCPRSTWGPRSRNS